MKEALAWLRAFESGELAVEPGPVRLGAIVDGVVEHFDHEAARKRLPIHVEVATGDLAIADARGVRHLLMQLLGEALELTETGKIDLRIQRRERTMVIDLIDTGIEITREHAERLFEPLVRLARAMHGDLVVVTGEGVSGMIARFTLPAVDAPPRPAPLEPARPAVTPDMLDGMRLLIVDDHEDVRTPLSLLLSGRGARVVEAAGGEAAIEIASREPFDLILMDVRMPDLDGLEATRRLRALGVRIPIIALTGDALERYPNYADSGYSAEFAKPIEIDQLVTMIRELHERGSA